MTLIVTPRQLAQRAQFYEQLGQLTAAGLTFMAALDLLMRNPPARSFREPIRAVLQQLEQGATVADSLQFLGSWVPAFDIALVRAAEHTGRLDVVFKMLAGYYRDRAALLRQLISNLAYPVFVFHFAIVLFPFISWFAGKLSGVGFFAEVFGILFPLYAITYLIIYSSQGKRGLKWRSIFERVCRPVPVLGSALHALALARLSAALEALLAAGVTVIEAWEMAAAGCGSPAMVRTVLAWRPNLMSGEKPSEVINAAPAQFPEVFANLYHSGEVSGQLDETLKRLHVYYQEEGARKLSALAKWVPQIIYYCVAGMVAFKVISYYSDYFHAVEDAGKI